MSPARSGTSTAFSERGFHRWLREFMPTGTAGLLPMGDDVAALRAGPHRSLLLTTDALSEGTHFLPGSPPEAVGAAAINASLSDLAAKGGRPAGALLDILLPPRTPPRWAQGVARGAEAAARRAACHVVGGDTKPAVGRAVIGTLVGWGGPKLAPRHGARPGDVLVTTGVVGGGGAAALSLAGGRTPHPAVLRGLLEIRPRLREGRWLVGIAHAMLDTSDGIGEAARLLAEASGVRIVLEPARFRLDPRLERSAIPGPERDQLAFFGGDYELLAAVPASAWARAAPRVPSGLSAVTEIGRVERGRGVRLERAGRRLRFSVPGWDPFVRPRPRLGPR